MTTSCANQYTSDNVREAINNHISSLADRLRQLNNSIHDHPELCHEEHHAHDAICNFLEELGFKPTRHAYGMATAFEVISGNGTGRCINFNAEYDALPGIGHACGHNLIATASVTGFVALAYAMRKFSINGRVQLLGTPAEEGGGGKIDLLNAGAYKDANVSLMMHPISDARFREHGVIGSSGTGSIACINITATYEGVSAHAAINPWEGVNALDAIVAAYNNVSMLRQQIRSDERIHGAIVEAPKITNAIPESTKTMYTIRSPSIGGVRKLADRVRKCLDAGALATGCKIHIEESPAYAELRLNKALCDAFQADMDKEGERIFGGEPDVLTASTDQGNVSYALPSLHALIGIPVADGSNNHSVGFTPAAATPVAHERSLTAGKAMAMTGLSVLVDDDFYARVAEDFEKDKARR